MHECGAGVVPNLNSIQEEPVQRGYLPSTCRTVVVISQDANGDLSLMNSVKQGRKNRESFISLIFNRATDAAIETCAIAPTVKTYNRTKQIRKGKVGAYTTRLCNTPNLRADGNFSPGVNKSIDSSASSISFTYVSMEWSGEKKGVTEQGLEQ